MIRFCLALPMMIAATSTAALSCLPTSPAKMFTAAAEAAQDYVVLLGTATFDDTALPPAMELGEAPAQPNLVPAAFEGNLMTADGFTTPYAGPLTLHSACAGPWCGRLDSPATVLAFALNTPDGPVLVVDPCGSKYIQDPDRAALTTVAACIRGGPCGTSD